MMSHKIYAGSGKSRKGEASMGWRSPLRAMDIKGREKVNKHVGWEQDA